MNLTKSHLRRQFNQVSSDYWPMLEDAARQFFPNGEFDAIDLFAIGSRETNWNPKYLSVPGDGGNGFGPMQIDRRSFPDWVESGAWRNPHEAILKGAEVLREKLDDAIAHEGQMIRMKHVGKTYTIEGRRLSPDERRCVTIAAYNCGRWAHYHYSKGRSPDHGTTGRDYSTDVLERATVARAWAPETSVAFVTCSECNGSGRVSA